jgi:RNA polymerase sigma-70 factor, ECF subfamily
VQNNWDAKEFQPACDDLGLGAGYGTMADQPVNDTAEARDARFEAEALRCLPELTRFARAISGSVADGDDLVQETFLRAYRFWNTYTPGTDCRRWLMTICRNIHRTRVARESVVQAVGDDAELETFATVRSRQRAREVGVDHLFDRLELGAAIQQAIAALSEPYRVVVQLIDVEGMTYEDVATALDIPIGTVRSRLFRARRLLQDALIEHARDAGISTARLEDQPGPRAPDARDATP